MLSEKVTPNEKLYYVLGCIETKAMQLSKEIDVPFKQCRNFLLNQVIKYLKTQSRNISIQDLCKYEIIKR